MPNAWLPKLSWSCYFWPAKATCKRGLAFKIQSYRDSLGSQSLMNLCGAVILPPNRCWCCRMSPKKKILVIVFLKDLISMEKIPIDSGSVWPSLLKALRWPFPKGVGSLSCELEPCAEGKGHIWHLGVSREWLGGLWVFSGELLEQWVGCWDQDRAYVEQRFLLASWCVCTQRESTESTVTLREGRNSRRSP